MLKYLLWDGENSNLTNTFHLFRIFQKKEEDKKNEFHLSM